MEEVERNLMFLDAYPLAKGEVHGYYTCKKCGNKCDGLIHYRKGTRWMCIKCYKEYKK